ncbi:MAG: sigma-54-dependent Fis family transcriptional regulator [Planctomycetes bacterium]|nr:sigma-54-dependent Fis family transcriptional regulator [Planctomycetota bacterium]
MSLQKNTSAEALISRDETGEAAAQPTETDVLVVNRDPEVRILLNKALFAGNYGSTFVSSAEETLASLRRRAASAVIACVENPESLMTIQALRSEFPQIPVIAFSRFATPDLVRDVMRCRVDDFIFGTFNGRRLLTCLNELLRPAEESVGGGPRLDMPAATRQRDAVEEGRSASPSRRRASVEIICENQKMQRVLEIAGKIAPTDSTVLIQGESGTGKEIVARWIHEHSHRAGKAFVEVNCGALPENLLESQLFGHEKGSFTGAVQRQLGLFEVSDGGTIFLDEIGEMSLDMQVKLLRVLQSQEFRRIGGSHVVRVNVRVLAASNRDLKEEVQEGRFRTDLFYRINVITLELPPLRERREEIPSLIGNFCERFTREKGLPRRSFSPAAIETLQKCAWEGNVRELENTVERLILLSSGETIEPEDIEEHIPSGTRLALDSSFSPQLSLDEVKRIHIARVLRENGGNKMRSARILKINVKTLYNLIRSLDITY